MARPDMERRDTFKKVQVVMKKPKIKKDTTDWYDY